jgi:signal transduction histidine kinase
MVVLAMGVLCTTAIIVSVTLIVLTTLIHESNKASDSALRGLSLAEETQIALLLADRTRDAAERTAIIEHLRQDLALLRASATGATEVAAVATAVSMVEAYLGARDDHENRSAERVQALEASHQALRKLVAINAEQARATRERADRWDRLANRIGLAAVAFVIAPTAFLVWYFGTEAFRPVLSLAAAMERFGQGDLSARARERGPSELRQIAERFNAMATSLAGQREARRAFLSGVAHDLRSPIQVLGMLVELLRTEAVLSPAQKAEILDRARRQVRRLEHMTEDLLDREQIESGRFELNLEAVPAAEILAHAVEPFAGMSSRHEIDVSVADSLMPIRGDRRRLDQVMTNLLSNAIKYSPAGGRVGIRAETEGDRIVLSVSDQGIGIPEEERRRIFEPFYRGARLRGTVPGTGLGLSIVRRIVDAHEGTITVQSAAGGGSTFEVRLPIAQAGAGVDAAP